MEASTVFKQSIYGQQVDRVLPIWVPHLWNKGGAAVPICESFNEVCWAVQKWTPAKCMIYLLNVRCCCCLVAKSCPTLCDPKDFSMPGFPVLHYLPEFAQTHVHWVGDNIQPSHPLSSPSLPAFNLSQNQGLFQWVGSSHQVAKVLELQHQTFQWILRVDFL